MVQQVMFMLTDFVDVQHLWMTMAAWLTEGLI